MPQSHFHRIDPQGEWVPTRKNPEPWEGLYQFHATELAHGALVVEIMFDEKLAGTVNIDIGPQVPDHNAHELVMHPDDKVQVPINNGDGYITINKMERSNYHGEHTKTKLIERPS